MRRNKINPDKLSFLQVRCSTCKKVFYSGTLGLDKQCDKEVRSEGASLVTANREMVVVKTFEPNDVLRNCECGVLE